MSRKWVSLNGWRGFYQHDIAGFESVKDIEGWTTFMPDEFHQHKVTVNNFLKQFGDGEITPPVRAAVAVSETTNVFSSSVDVFVEEGHGDEFIEWLKIVAPTLERDLN
jgi:hypothetical protein